MTGKAVAHRRRPEQRVRPKGRTAAWPDIAPWPSIFVDPAENAELRIFKRRASQGARRNRAPRLTPDPETELLKELKKSMKRVKDLESLVAELDRAPKRAWIPNFEMTETSQDRKKVRLPASSRRGKAIAIAVVGLLVAIAVGWTVYHLGTGPENPFDFTGPRWKDESATHFTFAAAGDFGGPGNIDSEALLKRVRAAGMSFFLALGDLGYTTDEAGWCAQMKRYVPEFLIVPGNHDDGDLDGGNLSKYVASCPYPLQSPPVAGNGTPGYGYEYYFDYPAEKPLARFIMIAAGLEGTLNYDYSEESPHTEWMEDAVDDAREKGIPWVVAGAHRECITVGKKDHCSMGQEIFDELVEANVDLILMGHDHVYERSNQLARSDECKSVSASDNIDLSCVVGRGSHGSYPKGNGTVVVVQGIGGNELDNVTIDGSDPEIVYIAEAMGQNANTRSGAPGFGSVFYTVTADSISATTDFCPPGSVAPDGQCTANRATVFTDQFSISNQDGSSIQSTLSASGELDSTARPIPPYGPEAIVSPLGAIRRDFEVT